MTDVAREEAIGKVDVQRSRHELSVYPVNDAPTFEPGPDLVIVSNQEAYRADWASAIGAGSSIEQTLGQYLEFVVNLDDETADLFIVPPSIDAQTGKLQFTPRPDVTGIANLTITLRDGGGTDHGGVNATTANLVLTITDATAPLEVRVVAVAPDPRHRSVDEITIYFSQGVTGFSIDDLRLHRDGGPNLLVGSMAQLATNEGVIWKLSNLSEITAKPGRYQLTLDAASSAIATSTGGVLANDLNESWNTFSPYDVNRSGKVTALDALLIITQLSRQQNGAGDPLNDPDHHYDVNDNGRVTALDALMVINQVARQLPSFAEVENVAHGPVAESYFMADVMVASTAISMDQFASGLADDSDEDGEWMSLQVVNRERSPGPQSDFSSASQRSSVEVGSDASSSESTDDAVSDSIIDDIASDIDLEYRKLSHEAHIERPNRF